MMDGAGASPSIREEDNPPVFNSLHLKCTCEGSPLPSQVQCPLCRAPALWCSLACAKSHLRACVYARTSTAHFFRVALETNEPTQPLQICCCCGNDVQTPSWIRCGICYHLKWCSSSCQAKDEDAHFEACFRDHCDTLEDNILQSDTTEDRNSTSAAHLGSRYRQSARDTCVLCDQTTWAWTAEDEGKKKIVNLVAHVQVLPSTAKFQILGKGLDRLKLRQRDARSLLSKLRQLDPTVARRFRLKSVSASRLVLRFINAVYSELPIPALERVEYKNMFDRPLALLRLLGPVAHTSVADTLNTNSFIAVSYCWHDATWAVEATLSETGSPISLRMWLTILELREAEDEGIWIDQLCIRQENEEEKQEAISAMDLIYESARLVVIPVEDMHLTPSEAIILSQWVGFNNAKNEEKAMESSSDFLPVLEKILKARWFSRAWCMHEYLTARRALLLLLVEPVEGLDEPEVAKIYLNDLLDITQWILGASQKTAMENSLMSVRRILKQFSPTHMEAHIPEFLKLQGVDTSAQVTNYTEILARCLAMHATVESDKVAIALNLAKLGLVLNKSGLSADDCCYAFSMLAYVAGDSSWLCNKGSVLTCEMAYQSPFAQLQTVATGSSWMRRPTILEGFPAPVVPRMSKVSDATAMRASFLGGYLDLKFLSGEWTWAHASESSLNISHNFVRSELCRSILSIRSTELVESSLSNLEDSLAAALDLGYTWLIGLFNAIGNWKPSDGIPTTNVLVESSHHSDQLDTFKSAASLLFGLEPESAIASDLALPVFWLIMFLYYASKPHMWTLVSKDKKFQALCDRPPIVVAGMRLGIPSQFTGSEFSQFGRLWVVSSKASGRITPMMKIIALGLGDIEDHELPQFHDVRGMPIVGASDSKGEFPDTALLESVQEGMRAAGISDDEIADTLNPERQYGKGSHLTKIDLSFWP